jgi:hypothetical protein
MQSLKQTGKSDSIMIEKKEATFDQLREAHNFYLVLKEIWKSNVLQLKLWKAITKNY